MRGVTMGWLLGLVACSTEPEPTEADACSDEPVLTWANFGQGFMLENCQACHAATSPNRQGAPEGVSFDTEEQAWELLPRILARATGDAPDMPPQDGVDSEDRERLRIWLTCGG